MLINVGKHFQIKSIIVHPRKHNIQSITIFENTKPTVNSSCHSYIFTFFEYKDFMQKVAGVSKSVVKSQNLKVSTLSETVEHQIPNTMGITYDDIEIIPEASTKKFEVTDEIVWTEMYQIKIDEATYYLSNQQFRDINWLSCLFDKCDYKPNSYNDLNLHLQCHVDTNVFMKYKCFFCGKNFEKPLDNDIISRHVENHMNNRFFCYFCFCKTSNINFMKRHLKRDHSCDHTIVQPMNENFKDLSKDIFVIGPGNMSRSEFLLFASQLIREYIKLRSKYDEMCSKADKIETKMTSSTSVTTNSKFNNQKSKIEAKDSIIESDCQTAESQKGNENEIYCCAKCNYTANYKELQKHHNEKHRNTPFQPRCLEISIGMEISKNISIEKYEPKNLHSVNAILLCFICHKQCNDLKFLEEHWKVRICS